MDKENLYYYKKIYDKVLNKNMHLYGAKYEFDKKILKKWINFKKLKKN